MSPKRHAVERLTPPDRLVGLINPLVRRLLSSRAHRLVSGQLLLLEFTGRRSGRRYAVPVGRRQLAGGLCVLTDSGWRVNFRGGRSCTVVLAGERVPAVGTLEEDPARVAAMYADVLDREGVKTAQRQLGIRVHGGRAPTHAELLALVERTGLSILMLDLDPDPA